MKVILYNFFKKVYGFNNHSYKEKLLQTKISIISVLINLILMHSGETIKLMRILKGFNQKGIAKELGISQPAYCKLEKRKKVNDVQWEKILAIMKCSNDDLEAINKFTPKKKINGNGYLKTSAMRAI